MSKLIYLTFGIRPQVGDNFESVKITENVPQAVAQISISQQLADQLELLLNCQQLVDKFENTKTLFQTVYRKSLEHKISATLSRNLLSPLTNSQKPQTPSEKFHFTQIMQ